MPRQLPDTGTFRVRIGDNILTFENWKHIPLQFDNLIEWNPDMIPPPHQAGEHELNEGWFDRFQIVLSREIM